jgi:hypothetical protein
MVEAEVLAVSVAEEDSSLWVSGPEGPMSGGVEEASSWPYAGGVVSISKRFGGEDSGSSFSRALFLPLPPDS